MYQRAGNGGSSGSAAWIMLSANATHQLYKGDVYFSWGYAGSGYYPPTGTYNEIVPASSKMFMGQMTVDTQVTIPSTTVKQAVLRGCGEITVQ